MAKMIFSDHWKETLIVTGAQVTVTEKVKD